MADNLTIDVLFANATGNQLGVLRAEVQNQDQLVGHAASLEALDGRPC
jgi:hypothetical protein